MNLRIAVASLTLIATAPLLAQTTPSPAPAPAPTPATAAAPAPQPVATLENREQPSNQLNTALRAGGLIILMRHERTNVPSRGDDYSRPANDCNAQRNLSPAGVAGAAETGTAIRALGWPIGRVLSSEMCRATETARFMFGRYEVEPRLMHHDNTPERTVVVSGRELNALLADIPRGQADNTVMVSHIGNIYFATGMRLSEGEFGVLQRQENGSYVILGQFDPGYIGQHARQALMEAERARPSATPTEAAAAPAVPRQ
jgi:phosphohistidine phosphatase SixA